MIMTTAPTRPLSKRGHGGTLRGDILTAASAVLAREGNDDAVTLRAVAREAGVTAPAIYAHFADRQDILRTVVADTFAELATAMNHFAREVEDPVRRLHAVCHAYLDFAAAKPHHYRILFQRLTSGVNLRGTDVPNADVGDMVGADAFGALLDATTGCIRSGDSSASEPVETTNQIWVGLHGQATLLISMPWHPWPSDRDRFADNVIGLLAQLTTPARARLEVSDSTSRTRTAGRDERGGAAGA